MVANVLARYDSTVISSSTQWTAGELSENMNKEIAYTSATTADLFIDPIALSHGLSLFQKQLNKIGLDAIIVSTFSKSVPDFNLTKSLHDFVSRARESASEENHGKSDTVVLRYLI